MQLCSSIIHRFAVLSLSSWLLVYIVGVIALSLFSLIVWLCNHFLMISFFFFGFFVFYPYCGAMTFLFDSIIALLSFLHKWSSRKDFFVLLFYCGMVLIWFCLFCFLFGCCVRMLMYCSFVYRLLLNLFSLCYNVIALYFLLYRCCSNILSYVFKWMSHQLSSLMYQYDFHFNLSRINLYLD